MQLDDYAIASVASSDASVATAAPVEDTLDATIVVPVEILKLNLSQQDLELLQRLSQWCILQQFPLQHQIVTMVGGSWG